jgi:hypothetical protein
MKSSDSSGSHRMGARKAARALVDLVRFAHAARRFRDLSIRDRVRGLPLLRNAWGNLGFVADVCYLLAVLDYADARSGAILECGSGLTTVLLALAAPGRLWSLEHANDWRRHVRMRLRLARTHANVMLSPLKPYGEFQWYDIPATLPSEFGLVVCDGPPGFTPGGRYGLLPLLGNRLPRGTVVLLDDAQRLDEQLVLKRWEEEAGWRYTIGDSGTATYAVVTV